MEVLGFKKNNQPLFHGTARSMLYFFMALSMPLFAVDKTTEEVGDADGTENSFTINAGSNHFEAVDDDPESADDNTTYIQGGNKADASMWLRLPDMPGGFTSADSVQFVARQHENGNANDRISLEYQVVDGDGSSTAISAVSAFGDMADNGSWSTDTSGVLSITGTNTLASWNAAYLKITQTHTQVQGGDATSQGRLTALKVIIYYTDAPPTVSTFSPADEGTDFSPIDDLVITFDEPVNTGSGNIDIKLASDSSVFESIPVGDARVTGGGTATITLNPDDTLANSTAYFVQIATTAFDDTASQDYAGITDATTWNFTSGVFLPPEDYSDWNDSTRIYFNTTSTGANVSGNVSNFPLLIRFSASDFDFSQALASGGDIRFADTDGTQLAYELEVWDSTNADASVWVNVPQITGNSQTDYINFYWDESSATDRSSGQDVFDTANGFRGVWHMDVTSGTETDITDNANDGTYAGTSPNQVDGIIHKAQDFTGAGNADEMDAGTDASVSFVGNLTASMWINENANTNGNIFEKLTPGGWTNGWGFYKDGGGTITFVTDGWQGTVLTSSISVGVWEHFVGVYDATGDSTILYKDGAYVSSGAGAAWTDVSTVTMASDGNGSYYKDTKLDELRLSNALRSADWIKLSYESQKIDADIFHFPPYGGFTAKNVIPAAQVTQSTAGDGIDTIQFKVQDWDKDSVTLNTFEYSVDGGSTWNAPTNADASGSLSANWDDNSYVSDSSFGAATAYSFTFDTDHADVTGMAGVDQSDVKFRFKVSDGTVGSVDYVTTDALTVDNLAPTNLASLAESDSTSTTVTMTWTVAVENNFNHYEIWYGTDLSDVQNRTGTAAEWDNVDDSDLATLATGSSLVQGLLVATKYYFKIWAVDDFGNSMTVDADSTTTLPSPVPQVTGWDPSFPLSLSQINADTVRIGYEVYDSDDGSVTITVETKLPDDSWVAWATQDDYIAGDSGSISVSTTTDRTMHWDFRAQHGSMDTTADIRVIADDGTNQDTNTVTGLVVDTEVPAALAGFSPSDSSSTSVSFTWTAATDGHFSHYEIWYGTTQSEVQNRSGGAVEWDDDDDSDLSTIGTTSTTVTGLNSTTLYYFKIWAIDSAGNETTLSDIDNYTKEPNIIPDGDGTTSGTWIKSTGLTFYETVDEDPEGADDNSSYFYGPNRGDGAIWLSLSNTPDNFDNADSVKIVARHHENGAGNDRVEMAYQIVDGDNSATGITATTTIGQLPDNGSWQTDTALVAVTGVNTQTSWDNAYIRIFQDYSSVAGGDDSEGRLTALSVIVYFSDTEAPVVSTFSPLDNAAGVGVNDNLVLTFDEIVDVESGDIIIKKTSDNSVFETIDVTSDNVTGTGTTTITVNPTGTFDGIEYYVLIDATAFDDPAGNSYAGISVTTDWSFTAADVVAPIGLANFKSLPASSTSATLTWTAVTTEFNFNHYEIWYGTNQSDVQGRTGSAVEWDDIPDDAALATMATTTTTITGLTTATLYYFKIWAIDDAVNEATLIDIYDYPDGLIPAWRRQALGAVNGGALAGSDVYICTGGSVDSLFNLNTSDGTSNWSFYTGGTGDCTGASAYYDPGLSKNLIAINYGANVSVLRDDGTSSATVRTVTFASNTGTPYIPDDSTFVVTYTNTLTRWDFNADAVISGWPETLTDISTSADPVIFNDEIYVGTAESGDGNIYKYDMDGTQTGAAINVGADVNLPMVIDQNTLYVAPNSANLYAIRTSDWDLKWSPASVSLNAANTGAPFSHANDSKIYVAVGSDVQRIDDNGFGNAAAVDWTYAAGGTVNNGPVVTSGKIFFGRNGGNFYHLTDGASPTLVTNWPYAGGLGNGSGGPFIDAGNSRVIFADDNGLVSAFGM